MNINSESSKIDSKSQFAGMSENQIRFKLKNDIADYLNNGGTIEYIDYGVSTLKDDVTIDRVWGQYYERTKPEEI